MSYLTMLCHGVFKWKPASSEWPARLPPMLRMTATSPTSTEYRHAGISSINPTRPGMRPMPAPLTLLDSAMPVTAALKSSRTMEMTNQIMRVPFRG